MQFGPETWLPAARDDARYTADSISYIEGDRQAFENEVIARTPENVVVDGRFERRLRTDGSWTFSVSKANLPCVLSRREGLSRRASFRPADAGSSFSQGAKRRRRYPESMIGSSAQWSALNWGSVPDWLAAVGTIGAFAATLVILGLDRRRSRRSLAVGLALWTTRSFRSTPGADKQTLTVHAFNASSGPIPVANVVSNRNGSDCVNEVLTSENAGFSELAPGAKTSVEIEVMHYVDEAYLFVFFVDHLGGRWAKRVSDGRLFRPARGRRLAGIESPR